jgi:hypothetical protein
MNLNTLDIGSPLKVFPQRQEVEAMMRIEEPKTCKQLRGFIGMVNYHRDMWRNRSHVLAPLTSLTSTNIPWKWGEEESKAFQEAKKILSKEVLLAFPTFDKTSIYNTYRCKSLATGSSYFIR